MKKQTGFTLLELTIVVAMIGIMVLALTPVWGMLAASQTQAYKEKHKQVNHLIGTALLNFASNSTTLGTLPSPYTGAGYTKTIYDPADTSTAGTDLRQALLQVNLSPSEINDDGTNGAKVRVYQRITGLSHNVPLFGQSGPLATLTYQYGAIYLTECRKNDATCNNAPAPGASAELTAANYSTFTTTGTDLEPYFVSTLPIQKQMLTTTAQRLDKIRDAFLTYFRGQQVTAAANDATNWFPPTSTMGGANPSTNQGCRDGWYALSSGTILATIGLSTAEYSTTAWGGAIQYCRDYDPTGTSGANVAPHYGAIRINKNVSQGIAPDAAVIGNNIILTF